MRLEMMFSGVSRRRFFISVWFCVLCAPAFALDIEEMESIVRSRVCPAGGAEVANVDCGTPMCPDGRASNECFDPYARCTIKTNGAIDKYNAFVRACTRASRDREKGQGETSRQQQGVARPTAPDQHNEKRDSAAADLTRRIEAAKKNAQRAEAANRRNAEAVQQAERMATGEVTKKKEREAAAAAGAARARQSEIDRANTQRDLAKANKWHCFSNTWDCLDACKLHNKTLSRSDNLRCGIGIKACSNYDDQTKTDLGRHCFKGNCSPC